MLEKDGIYSKIGKFYSKKQALIIEIPSMREYFRTDYLRRVKAIKKLFQINSVKTKKLPLTYNTRSSSNDIEKSIVLHGLFIF